VIQLGVWDRKSSIRACLSLIVRNSIVSRVVKQSAGRAR
jgi:hypothetical protein